MIIHLKLFSYKLANTTFNIYKHSIKYIFLKIYLFFIFRETDIFYENIKPIARSVQVALFVAHKVVQECFYYENPRWSPSFWLNEAIVIFLEYYIINQVILNILQRENKTCSLADNIIKIYIQYDECVGTQRRLLPSPITASPRAAIMLQ